MLVPQHLTSPAPCLMSMVWNSLMRTYLADAEGNGATLALNSQVTEGDATGEYCKA